MINVRRPFDCLFLALRMIGLGFDYFCGRALGVPLVGMRAMRETSLRLLVPRAQDDRLDFDYFCGRALARDA